MKKAKSKPVRGTCTECGKICRVVQDRCEECYFAAAAVLVTLEDA